MISVGIPVHLIPMLVERGFNLDAAVAAFAVIGPAQVAARFLTGFGERPVDRLGQGRGPLQAADVAGGADRRPTSSHSPCSA